MKEKKFTGQYLISMAFVVICCVGSIFFVYNNQSFYDRPIAEVVSTTITQTTEVEDNNGNKDRLFVQNIIAELRNGEYEGKQVMLINEYSLSGAYDQEYQPGNELFVSLDKDSLGTGELRGTIQEVKRDQYMMIIAWVFILLLLFVGKKQGLFSLFTLAVNALILSYALDIYANSGDVSLLVVSSAAVILFTGISLLLVNGFNEKTYAAVSATLIVTFATLLISYIVVEASGGKGLHYEEMQFLTRPYKIVFMAGILIGCLGAVMDVAITLSSSIFGLYENDHNISIEALKKSGFDIGKDIMGTMTNILFFVYISGAIPMLILFFKNASPLGFTLSLNLSLEVARALTGGIGIVLTIPIGIYTSIFFINRKRARV
ncbi:YibE/F family protein [Bacillus sp. SCS-153A]|uniref:YibE/F family protein n=1 Tax=Rossellomorea sedimentorum TaxID=3115294 RepID=UPI003905D4E4